MKKVFIEKSNISQKKYNEVLEKFDAETAQREEAAESVLAILSAVKGDDMADEGQLDDKKYLEAELVEVEKRVKNLGHAYEILDVPLNTILDRIITGKSLGSMNLLKMVQNVHFRFITTKEPTLSYKVSNAFAAVVTASKQASFKEIAAKSVKQRNKNADEFAINMFEVINKLKADEQVSTYRDTVNILNKHRIPTSREKGKWHLKTLQNLEDRWKKLGLTQSKPDQP